MEDTKIIALYFDRNEEAICATGKKYGTYCFTIANNILKSRDDAEEAVNDTYFAAWNAIPPHKPLRLSAFLGKITRRISINKWLAGSTQKRGGGEPALALEELSQCIPGNQTVEAALEAAELSRLLNTFVRTLPETERHVFLLRYWYLLPVKEIANRFGFTQSKVKSMLLRTRNRLRMVLEQEGIHL